MNLKIILVLAVIAALAQNTNATVTINGTGVTPSSGSQSMGLIPDGSSSGRSTTIGISGSDATSITDVQVILHGSGTFVGDLYAYLTHDNGFAVLLNRVGATSGNNAGYSAGYSDPIRFSDGAANDVHTYQNQSGTGTALTGTWQPDGRNISPNSSGSAFDTAPRTANFATFNTGTANGNWTLFVADLSGGSTPNTIDSWDLEIMATPEPVNVALGIFGGVFGVVQGVRYWKKKKLVAAA